MWKMFATQINVISFFLCIISDSSDVEFTVLNGDARQMQYGLMVLLVSCYAVSGVLYLISYQQMRGAAKARDSDRAAV